MVSRGLVKDEPPFQGDYQGRFVPSSATPFWVGLVGKRPSSLTIWRTLNQAGPEGELNHQEGQGWGVP